LLIENSHGPLALALIGAMKTSTLSPTTTCRRTNTTRRLNHIHFDRSRPHPSPTNAMVTRAVKLRG
jgi:hypothetical protein